MKLRIKGDSIRLRLSQAEVKRIATGKSVKEVTTFPGGESLVYVFEPSPRSSSLGATFFDRQLVISLPLADAIAWATGSNIAIQTSLGSLAILIEKDFVCLKPREFQTEDESDLFPNPNVAHGHCT